MLHCAFIFLSFIFFIFFCALCFCSHRKRGQTVPVCLWWQGFPLLKDKDIFPFFHWAHCLWLKSGLYTSFKGCILTCHSRKMTGVINDINIACWLTDTAYSGTKMEQRLINIKVQLCFFCYNKSNGKKGFIVRYENCVVLCLVLLLHQCPYGAPLKYAQKLMHKYQPSIKNCTKSINPSIHFLIWGRIMVAPGEAGYSRHSSP